MPEPRAVAAMIQRPRAEPSRGSSTETGATAVVMFLPPRPSSWTYVGSLASRLGSDRKHRRYLGEEALVNPIRRGGRIEYRLFQAGHNQAGPEAGAEELGQGAIKVDLKLRLSRHGDTPGRAAAMVTEHLEPVTPHHAALVRVLDHASAS